MSSRSNGVMNEELIFWYRSWVIASLSCSTSTSRSLTDSTSASGRINSESSAVPRTRFSAARLKKSKKLSSLGRSLIRTGTPHAGPGRVEGMLVHFPVAYGSTHSADEVEPGVVAAGERLGTVRQRPHQPVRGLPRLFHHVVRVSEAHPVHLELLLVDQLHRPGHPTAAHVEVQVDQP